ncbi:NADP-dependent malic enzyme-like [Zingiber officinale]|uniref:NADP-dependent malic enzyme-like n=1 Tax=Zingiber officinale TaxID=94328 RepID=UPI001C4A9C4F|nr:NADP-dependent malic enzyme-like [Zingiber officinale]
MLSLDRTCVLRCDELLGPLRASRRRVALPAPTTVRCQTRSGGEMNGRGISVDNTIKEIEPKFVESSDDVTRDDVDNDEQFMMPWTVSVASGYTLLRNPQHNKGLAFNEKERDAHYLRGLLPPVCISQELQEKKIMHNLRQYQVPLQRYMAIMDMQELNEKLFYKLLIDHVEELLPVVYTPTVGEACQKYGSIFRHPRGLYISLNEKGRILEVLRNWPERDIQVIVVTDGERILGLGDLGCQGMGIPVGKLALYTALGGVRPSACLPVTIDVGTNNEQLLNDEFYIGLRRRRATGQAYAELLEEFMDAVKLRYGEKVLIQFEDFANHNAFELLAKYRKTHLVFNDDIQGTASVVLAGLFGALKIVGGTLAEHSFLFLGAGEAGTGIAELIALEMSKQTKAPVEETRKRIWMVDSKGLIVNSRKDSLQHFKQPWAHDHEPVNNLLAAIKAIKPTILIGSSGVGKTFTKEVVEAMTTFNEKPIILALSNPTLQSECSAEEAYAWSKGRAIFASGSPFEPVEYDGKVLVPGQSNNAYIFPGFGLGLVISGATRVHDDMLLAASEALAQQVTQENLDKGMVYPPFSNIRKISAHIAANVAAKAYELGLASQYPRPKDLVKYAENFMYKPVYHKYR